MTQAEFDYYQSVSGLPATASLDEHRTAYWRAQVGDAAGLLSQADAAAAFFRAETGVADVPLARFTYFAERSGLTAGTLADHMAAFFANPPEPEPDVELTLRSFELIGESDLRPPRTPKPRASRSR